jgi:NTP pyrophosphatase (non-canonical NTP hydrolase)
LLRLPAWSRWERLHRAITRWADKTFPHDRIDTLPKARHLREECKELEEAVADLSWPSRLRTKHISDELADILIIAIHLAHCEGIDLYTAVKTKFETVKLREWLPPDEHGVIRHKHSPRLNKE